ncbi:DUF1080 domain-containing protein [Chitinophaga oryziterrae]|uniref:DUF1080 domain-containing protein n=1 Tax=Chitinophaga oryziterrae TaxID=1031224 RepID=A0A6N8J3U4_9BACT|nr:DUF1080 domain-containing protein [Chitinophaga oryziterrae]MVT39905.1 DUF1080 domain-containing protein [Chitinophaga oryziterrae]
MVLRSKNHASRSLMGFLCLCGMGMAVVNPAAGQSVPLQDLSSFHDPGKSWSIAGDAIANLEKPDVLKAGAGTGVLLNVPDKEHPGKDLFSNAEYGDVDIELDYMMAPGANSGVYLQGRYEIQLLDSWSVTNPKSGDNGGIYERWDDSRPAGQQGYDGHAPRYNVSRAPGLWQHMKISFQAPRFDAAGHKTENARMLLVELNGVTIHEDVELLGPTRGSASEEKAVGPLRLQGDHGAVAFRNITITKADQPHKPKDANRRDETDPILVDAPVNTILRSFMDVPGTRIVHAVSVGSPENVHYTYDMDRGMLVQVWRGGFLDATSMWHDRGNGCSRPRGTVQYLGSPAFTLAKLSSADAAWLSDTTGTGYRPKGYVLDDKDRPTFKYFLYGAAVTDAVRVVSEGHGVHRELTVAAPVDGLYAKLAQGRTIEALSKDMYIIDGKSYYLQLEDAGGEKPVIRDAGGLKELIIPVRSKLSYSILF